MSFTIELFAKFAMLGTSNYRVDIVRKMKNSFFHYPYKAMNLFSRKNDNFFIFK